jgi:hypothetical protein
MRLNKTVKHILPAAALALLLVQSGCGGGTTVGTPAGDNPAGPRAPLTLAERDAVRARFANIAPARVYAALEALGAPSRHAAFVRQASGKQVSETLPYTLLAEQQYEPGVNESGYFALANAAPGQIGGLDLQPTGPNLPESFAYAIYKVSDITEQVQTLQVSAGVGQYGVTAYDFAANSWRLLYFGSNPNPTLDMTQPAGADWTNAGDDMGIIVFALHPDTATVFSLTFSSDPPPPPTPPIADLQTDPAAGTAPLEVTLNAQFSFDNDGIILTYAFDPEGDGTFLPVTTEPTMQFTYETEGTYHPMVEVTDDDGLKDTAEDTVVVSDGTYDEVENNDSLAQANPLPAFPFEGFSGNVGDGGVYDGDNSDMFTFDAAAGETWEFRVTAADLSATIGIELYDGNGDVLAMEFNNPLTFEFTDRHVGPFYLNIFSGGIIQNPTDYFIEGYASGSWDEIEDNDSAAAPQWVQASFELSKWKGSLGQGNGYIDNDGDSHDWLGFFDSFNIGDQLTIDTSYDALTGNIDIMLLDNEGDVLAASADVDGTEQIVYTFQDGDVEPFFLHLEGVSGYSDYLVDAAIVPGGGEDYDEIENNDMAEQANELPGPDFTGFRGNIGNGGAYDGDNDDWFGFSAREGETRQFTIDWAANGGYMSAELYQDTKDGAAQIRYIETSVSPIVITYTKRSIENGPFYLRLLFDDIAVDYTIDCSSTLTFDENEDNDDETEANALPYVSEDGFSVLYDFTGSFGTGGADYDGDISDWFSLEAAADDFIDFDVYYDPGTGSIQATLYDANGIELATSFDIEAGRQNLQYFNSPAAPGPFTLRLSGAGFSEYVLESSIFSALD